ncbi:MULTISPECIES: hypothetical protein [unclassified Mesorhizobium]|uniref:hypothetical protein n=1 Tax=unclassified Mesorhizobium TaxID=325217 RepID=UPI0003CE6EAC|nr:MULTISPECIES: hypothetical protein [unclassified Mesorhizobium]ESY58317.1 hypothetical protein X745_04690 [Mesorhizobium sp. LNJC374B00]ESY59452.1 hypothetical protein X744_13335 [Mesorhizobium sp. LNJC372A00]WJI79597.1 hypothetical protein NLY34_22390 [Mesorhizobium sp. C374B]WJI86132.1 hypothetical protein NLY42_24785 [Mesorhizobium sp. C372A]
MENVYIDNKTYARLALALAEIEPCPFSGKREPYQIVDALMAAEIWPASVLPESTSLTARAWLEQGQGANAEAEDNMLSGRCIQCVF